jgi:hypothetical protein
VNDPGKHACNGYLIVFQKAVKRVRLVIELHDRDIDYTRVELLHRLGKLVEPHHRNRQDREPVISRDMVARGELALSALV